MCLILILGVTRIYALNTAFFEKLPARNLSITVKPQVVNSRKYLHMRFFDTDITAANLLCLMSQLFFGL